MNRHLPDNPRLVELLADRAVQGLDEREHDELRSILAAHPQLDPRDIEYSDFDLVAAQADLAMAGGEALVPLPAELRGRIEAAATSKTHATGAAVLARLPAPVPSRAWMGWLAAAAALAIAAAGWWPRLVGQSGAKVPLRQQFDRFVAGVPDLARAPWGPFNALDSGAPPEVSGVTGEVVWSQAQQRGFMKFTNLQANNPSVEQYQLWIVDAKRGLSQRISGGVFDATAGELVIPIEPRLHVDQAAVFAVTIEQPGGTWVSDMKRRVVLAQLKG